MNTKESIINASKQLLSVKNVSSISVQEIADLACVSKTTFYKYFKDKYDVSSVYYQEYVKEHILRKHSLDDYYGITVEVYQFMKENRSFFRNALAENGQNSFYDFYFSYGKMFLETIYKANNHLRKLSEEDNFKIDMIVAGQIYGVKYWLNNNSEMEAEDVVRWSLELIPEQYIHLLSPDNFEPSNIIDRF